MLNYNINQNQLEQIRDRNVRRRTNVGRLFPKVSGVYAIHGPNGVYVGESENCWARASLGLAASLGLDCGIVRELFGSTKDTRLIVEKQVQDVFKRRGFSIVKGLVRDYT